MEAVGEVLFLPLLPNFGHCQLPLRCTGSVLLVLGTDWAEGTSLLRASRLAVPTSLSPGGVRSMIGAVLFRGVTCSMKLERENSSSSQITAESPGKRRELDLDDAPIGSFNQGLHN